MLFRMKNVISDGNRAKIVPAGFTTWHSHMTIDEIPGEETTPIAYPKFQELDVNIHSKPVDLSLWLPKRRPPCRPYTIRKKHLL